MSFSESIKKEARRKANYRCCWCEELTILHVHHIIPEAEEGEDVFDNAIALCPTDHTLLGSNPDLRKYMKEKRDWWYEKCAQQIPHYLIEQEVERQISKLHENPQKLKILKENTGEPR